MRDLGWDVAGVEPDHKAAELIRTKFDLNIHEGLLEDAVFPDNTFDVITMHHVIEHLPDPVRTLKQCLRVLRQGGRLVLVTPNPISAGSKRYGPDWRDLDPPRHLHLFTPRSIAHVIAEAGFEMELSRTLARCVMQIWSTSDSIWHGRLCERNAGTRGGALTSKIRRITRILKYPAYQMWGSTLLCADPQSGEEILISAKKP